MSIYGIQTVNNLAGFMDSNQPAEFVLASGELEFTNSLVYSNAGVVQSSVQQPNLAYFTLTLQKYALGMQMIKVDPDGYHTFADSVYMVAGSSRGAIPMTMDGFAWQSSQRNWSETDTTITIRYVVLPPCINNSLAATSISGKLFVMLVGSLPLEYEKSSHGIRLFSKDGLTTFDSALMPSNAKHIITAPSAGYGNYTTPSSMISGGFAEGVKMAVSSRLGLARGANNLYVTMALQFSSDGLMYALRPNGYAWSTPWQSHYGPHCLTADYPVRIFYASDYF